MEKTTDIYLRDSTKTTYAHVIIESENERIIDVRSSVDLYEYSKLLLSYEEIYRDNMIEDFTFISEIRAWYYEVEVNYTTNLSEFKFNLIEKLNEIGEYYDMQLMVEG